MIVVEHFFGPWILTVVRLVLHGRVRIVIDGSDSADGRHELSAGAPLQLAVDGGEWTLWVEVMMPGFSVWGEWATVRQNGFDLEHGMVATVEVGVDLAPPIVVHAPYLRLQCTSTDPSVHPLPSPNPPDFSLPLRDVEWGRDPR